jgi:hypothetical protein
MLRRILLLISLCLPLPAFAAGDVIAEAYNALSLTDRVSVQEEMQTGGLYDGPLDGSYSEAVKTGIEDTAEQVFSNGYEGPAMDMTTEAGVTTFLKSTASGDMAKWIYGEGEELDG